MTENLKQTYTSAEYRTAHPGTARNAHALLRPPTAGGKIVTAPEHLDHFCEWLKVTPLANALSSAEWVVPAVQTVHILAIGAVVGSGLILTLRALGLIAPDQTLATVNLRSLRVIWWSLPILLVTGLLMITAEPARSLENPAFALKMALLLTSIAVNLGYQVPLKRNPDFWELSAGRRRVGRLIALVTLGLWVGVVFSGRWIAYVQAG